MLTLSCKFGVICCSFGFAHPAACTLARVPLTCAHVHRPRLLPNLHKKCANRLGLSSGFRSYIYNSEKVFKKKLETPPKKLGPLWGTHHPPTSTDRTHTYTTYHKLSKSAFRIYSYYSDLGMQSKCYTTCSLLLRHRILVPASRS